MKDFNAAAAKRLVEEAKNKAIDKQVNKAMRRVKWAARKEETSITVYDYREESLKKLEDLGYTVIEESITPSNGSTVQKKHTISWK